MEGLWKKGLAALSSTAVAVALLAGCGGGSTNNATSNSTGTNAGTPQKGGTINIDINDDVAHFDPAVAYDQGSWEFVWGNIYNQLLKYKPQTTDLEPDLATSMPEISSDGLTYTFHIKKGIKFSNGDPVTAQSFVDEFKRILTPSVQSPAVGFIDPAIQGADDFYKGKTKELTGVVAKDDYTLVIKLTKPQTFFTKVLAMPFFSPVDEKYIQSIGGDKAFDHKPMGTGPFMMQSYTPGKGFVLVRNPNYYDSSKPYLDEIDVHVNSNQESTALSFEQGNTALMDDYTQQIPAQYYLKWSAQSQYSSLLKKQPYMGIEYVGLNTQVAPFNNKLVRQAVEYAINKDNAVKLANGRGQVTNEILPPGIQGYVQQLGGQDDVNYKYDPNKAKQLLKESGVTNLNVTMIVRNRAPLTQIAQSIQADLNAVGFHVTLKQVGESDYLSQAESGKAQFGLYGWFADFPDPYDFLDVLFNSNQAPINNWANYKNPTVDKELQQAATMPDGPERYKLYDKIQDQILDDAAWVPLYNPVNTTIHQSWVNNYYTSPVMEDPLADLWVSKH
ncbi:peptide ABC transporter substrate-binding protein [Alicyclobacillus contaminans]|uniref:ABC transporter substrate-binding protein n=1 Tax=Alicyclobacillus contaminans TaxID=392016 RepID=UPI0004062D7F|nr:ABC transporter substrate-binding protein [Alicyclobacillus contaminans]GMA51123.1 peptide ABC transporter substrate-binding protein [Alicyclobacillus contaminans]